jgi:nucleotide-binding universal stress UspA family protein
MKILLCYDGSADAKTAVRLAGHLFDGHTAIVLTVWESYSTAAGTADSGVTVESLDWAGIDRARAQTARDCAEEGSGHARAAGMPASGRAVPHGGTLSETILDQAAEAEVDLIVLGSRGLSDLTAIVRGSVSRAVLQDADRPVLVVPASEVAVKRARRRLAEPIDAELLSARV